MATLENGVSGQEAILTYAEAFPPLSSPSPSELEQTEPGTTRITTGQAIPISTVTQVGTHNYVIIIIVGVA